MSSCFSRASFASAPDFCFFFSSLRLVCEASVFESLVLLQAARAGWPSFSILSLLSRFFLFSFGFRCVGFWDVSIVHRPAPLPSCLCSSRSFLWLAFQSTLPLIFAFSSSRTKLHTVGACNRSFLVDSTWTYSPVLFAYTGCLVSCFLIQILRPLIFDNLLASKQLHCIFLVGLPQLYNIHCKRW